MDAIRAGMEREEARRRAEDAPPEHDEERCVSLNAQLAHACAIRRRFRAFIAKSRRSGRRGASTRRLLRWPLRWRRLHNAAPPFGRGTRRRGARSRRRLPRRSRWPACRGRRATGACWLRWRLQRQGRALRMRVQRFAAPSARPRCGGTPTSGTRASRRGARQSSPRPRGSTRRWRRACEPWRRRSTTHGHKRRASAREACNPRVLERASKSRYSDGGCPRSVLRAQPAHSGTSHLMKPASAPAAIMALLQRCTDDMAMM